MQSFGSTLSFPAELELGLHRPRFNFRLKPIEEYHKYLRYPGPEQGLDYRLMRAGVILVLHVKKFWS